MKISQKLENACRVLARLARQHDGRQVVRVEDLAKVEGISPTFLLQGLNELRRAGLVHSKRGKHGGYMLAHAPSAITLGQITRAVEGKTLQIEAAKGSALASRVASTWEDVARRLDAMLEEITLEQIASGDDDSPMFYI